MKWLLRTLALAIALSSLSTTIVHPPATAVTASDWKAGRIIDDGIFTNANDMSVADIQSFLNSKVPNCDTNGTQPATEYGRSDLTHAQYAASRGWAAPPYVCLRNFYEVPKTVPGPGIPANNYTGSIPTGAISAAQMIYNAAQQSQINPKVLLVMIQKESSGPLTTDTWPLPGQYTYAMGAHCPDSGPGGSANCNPNYAGFSIQISESAGLLRWYLDSMTQSWWQYKKPFQNNTVLWQNAAGSFNNPSGTLTRYDSNNDGVINASDALGCGYNTVFIESKATAALYTYTPYQPNTAALANMYGTGDSCSAYGNRNFWRIYSDWFGSTHAFVYGGVSYSTVFDMDFYLNRYPDIKSAFSGNTDAAFNHFINFGMMEGRQAISDFNVISYKNRYPDLRAAFGTNLQAYYRHYITSGKSEGRIAIGDEFNGTSMYNGVDYSAVYNFDYYEKNNPDIKAAFGLDDNRALSHFINYGMAEGRQGNADFNVNSYKNRYYDLRRVYGDNARAYAVHYILYGKQEGRIAIGDYLGGISKYNGVDYSAVYNFDYYEKNNPDIKAAFGLDDNRALSHFINYGMAEGRQGNADFNVNSYSANYIDLQTAFGQNLRLYYLHYIYYGKAEARTAI